MELKGFLLESGAYAAVTIEGEKIAAVKTLPADQLTAAERETVIAPSFLDIQVNGHKGISISLDDLTPERVRTVTDTLASAGTSHYFPTIVTGPKESMLRNFRVLREAVENDPVCAKAIPGYHLEGPFVRPETGPRGGHHPDFVRPPTLEEYEELQSAAGGRIVYLTIAPEVEGSMAVIDKAIKDGLVVAIGHADPTPEQVTAAIDAGCRLSTHLGNACYFELPRHQNLFWAQLADDRIHVSILADGHNVPGIVLKSMIRAKGVEKMILASDVVEYAGLPPGIYEKRGRKIEIREDGRAMLLGTRNYAGSVWVQNENIATAMDLAGVTLAEGVQMSSLNPARLFNLADRIGTVATGFEANLVGLVCRYHPARLEVKYTVRAGEYAYQA